MLINWTMKFLTLTLLLAAVKVDFAEPLNILGIFQHPRFSHFKFFQAITRGLALVGHNVTVISHFPQKTSIPGYRDLPLSGMDTQMNGIDIKSMKPPSFYDHFEEFFLLYGFAEQACNLTLHSPALSFVLNEKLRYDVLLMEQFNTDCLMSVAYLLRAPVVAMTSSAMMPWLYERFGSPLVTSHMPVLYMAYSGKMNFLQRLSNWLNTHALCFLYRFYSVPSADAIVRARFGHDAVPSVAELAMRNTSLILANTHFSLSGAKPHSPTIVEVGGVHIEPAKVLPSSLQDWLDGADRGVIVISWGSMIRAETLPAEKRNALLRALKRLKQRVIWKWENDIMPNKPANVFISKWLPQSDLLCHPKVRAYMTHGGLLGVTEAVHCGVPTIVTPINGDQFVNAAALEYRGMGIVLPYSDMTEERVFQALERVLRKSYMDRAKRVSFSFNNRPMTPLDSAIWWVEYVANTSGAPLLRSSAGEMSAFTYYSFDVYVFMLLVLGSLFGLLFFAFKFLCSSIQRAIKMKLS